MRWHGRIDNDFQERRLRMVKEQIEARGVSDARVLNAMRKVERHRFVPAEMMDFAYEDRPLPIGFNQTISQPYIVAYMTEAADLKETDKVLEVGTGSGYQAAVLGDVAGGVYTLERVAEFAHESAQRFKELGYSNIFVKHSDGYLGWEERAPFDAMIVTAAPAQIPTELLRQLKTGGRMIIPLGSVEQDLYRITKEGERVIEERLCSVRFVPMVQGCGGFATG